ncbi:hypothetical protein, partial [Mycoplasma phocoeninasale]|uniref:hypothetical protein n=1 Tax=Mycoplasma phocoeninasale TaxID=2726117 RepID=UPI001967D871
AVDDSADYSNINELSFEISAKQNLNTIIKINETLKVEELTISEFQKLIKAKYPQIDINQLEFTITDQQNGHILVKAKNDSKDYIGEVNFNVAAKIDLTKEIKVDGLGKVNEVTEDEIKRIVNEANAGKEIKWEQLKITINGNKITIKAVDDSADYSNTSELSFEISAKQNLNTIIKINETLKVEELTISEVQKLIKAKYPQIDINQLEFTITDQQNGHILVKAKNDSKDYIGEVNFNVAAKIDLTKEIKVDGLGKVNEVTEDEIKRIVNEANAGKEIKWEQLKITINGNKITIKAVDDSADYSNTSELSFEISAKQNLNTIIKINETLKVEELTISEVQKLIKAKYPQIDIEQLEFTIADQQN